MDDQLRPRRRRAARRSPLLTIAVLATALLVDVALTYLAVIGVLGTFNGSAPTLVLALPFLVFGLGVAALFVGAGRVARWLPAGPKPFLSVPAVSAAGFLFASALDVLLFVTAYGIITLNPASYVIASRVVILVAWVFTAVVWSGACVLSESRRRSGVTYRAPVVIAGFVMAAIQILAWVSVAAIAPPTAG